MLQRWRDLRKEKKKKHVYSQLLARKNMKTDSEFTFEIILVRREMLLFGSAKKSKFKRSYGRFSITGYVIVCIGLRYSL